jgi:hypothetical protein
MKMSVLHLKRALELQGIASQSQSSDARGVEGAA